MLRAFAERRDVVAGTVKPHQKRNRSRDISSERRESQDDSYEQGDEPCRIVRYLRVRIELGNIHVEDVRRDRQKTYDGVDDQEHNGDLRAPSS